MANQTRDDNPSRDEVLKRMLKMPPKPHKIAAPKAKPKKSKKGKPG